MKADKSVGSNTGLKSSGIFCVAVLIGLAFSYFVYPRIQVPLSLRTDPDKFGELGSNIYHGDGFRYAGSNDPTMDRAPMYPYFIAVVYELAKKEDFHAVQIAQAVLHGLTGIIIFLIGKKYLSPRSALIAQLVCALHPALIWFVPRLWIETFLVFLLALSIFLIVLLFERQTIAKALAGGIFLGALILTKSVFLFLPFLLLLILLIKAGVPSLKYSFILIVAAYGFVLPWTIRNYHVSQEIVPVQTTLGMNLIQGDVVAERWREEKFSSSKLWTDGIVRADSILKGTGHTAIEPEGDRIIVRAARDIYEHQPIAYMKRCGINFLTFWYLGESEVKSITMLVLQAPMILFALIGMVKTSGVKPSLAPLILVVFYGAIVYSMIYGIGRYSVPFIPVLSVLALHGIRKK